MVERGANIDLFFRNGLRDFEVLPPPEIWNSIKPVVRKRQKSLFFLRAAASVAIIVSAGTVTYFLTGSLSDQFKGTAVTLNQDSAPEGSYMIKQSGVSRILKVAENLPVITTEPALAETNDSFAGNNQLPYSLPKIDLFTPIQNEKKLPGRTVKSNSINAEAFSTKPAGSAISNVSMPSESPVTAEKDLQPNRWSLGAMVTPTYYSGFSVRANDAGEELLNSEKGVVSYSGGFSFSYNVSKRLTIQTGLSYSAIGHKISGVGSFSGFNTYFNAKSGSSFSILTSSGAIVSNNPDIYLMDQKMSGRILTTYTLDVFDPAKADLKYLSSSLIQNFNYLEVPFVMKYKFLDRKVDFNLIGAVSYNILIGNSAYAYANDSKYYLGKTEGLSPITFSSSIGMGMEYSLSTRLLLNIEPTFRYYITPLGGAVGSSIHPYSFGILSGFSYRF
jgi:hypothetical protein